jgi:DNA-binding transcriptional MerR regulator
LPHSLSDAKNEVMIDLLKETYSTAEVMETFDIGRNTLRLYEEMGLFSELERTDSGYRIFKKHHLEDLKFILQAKEVGFTLNEIKELFGIMRANNQMTCGTVSDEISDKLSHIETQLKLLNAKKSFLSDFLNTCGSKAKDSNCKVIEAGFTKSACC